MLAEGLLAGERSEPAVAEDFHRRTLLFARAHGDAYLESTSLLNLGFESLAQGHFDEALDRSEEALAAARAAGARILALVAEGNIAWAYYRLGDSERALELARDAERQAAETEDVFDQGNELTNIGYIYMDRNQFNLAADYFRRALTLAEGIKAKQDSYNALRVLARLSVLINDLEKASDYARRALLIAQESKVHVDELYPRLIQGQIAARRGDPSGAEKTFAEVERDPVCPVFLKWEAEHSLALLSESGDKSPEANRYYRLALATFEGARSSVRHESSQLSFLTNGWRIYDDYIHFLVARGKTEEALRWADYSRARTLAEGLGILPAKSTPEPPPLHAAEIARAVDGTLLFYWLGEKQSYLWAITPQSTQLFTLPPGPEIEPVARRYREAMTGPSATGLANADGQRLYRTLVAPAERLLQKGRVFVIPDGGLNNLNFDTLITLTPAPHYWIDDAVIANASSLRMLAASSPAVSARKNLLLMGDTVAPNSNYPELARAGAQVQAVAAHFPSTQERIFTRDHATPQAYFDAKPEQYSNIHFVAHGTASRLSPLDSAIILSRSTPESESFKLYARDIIQHRLSAELVTISACYGSGTRSYSGEGLVGLSWAFQRAGAHNVVAALWEASDAPTEQLMKSFYDELNRGAAPDTALRTAKLGLLHNSAFKNPFYWAPFQLYTQGRPRKFAHSTEQPVLRSAAIGLQ